MIKACSFSPIRPIRPITKLAAEVLASFLVQHGRSSKLHPTPMVKRSDGPWGPAYGPLSCDDKWAERRWEDLHIEPPKW